MLDDIVKEQILEKYLNSGENLVAKCVFPVPYPPSRPMTYGVSTLCNNSCNFFAKSTISGAVSSHNTSKEDLIGFEKVKISELADTKLYPTVIKNWVIETLNKGKQ